MSWLASFIYTLKTRNQSHIVSKREPESYRQVKICFMMILICFLGLISTSNVLESPIYFGVFSSLKHQYQSSRFHLVSSVSENESRPIKPILCHCIGSLENLNIWFNSEFVPYFFALWNSCELQRQDSFYCTLYAVNLSLTYHTPRHHIQSNQFFLVKL